MKPTQEQVITWAREAGLHLRAFIPWDKELEEMYKLIGQWPEQGREQ